MEKPNLSHSIILKHHFGESILYLFNTEYAFCNEKLLIVNFSQYLHDHLRKFGYETILFLDSKKGVHVLPHDTQSLNNLNRFDEEIIRPLMPTVPNSEPENAKASVNNAVNGGTISLAITSKRPKNTGIKKDYRTGLSNHHLTSALDNFLNAYITKKNDTILKDHKVAIIIDFDTLMTMGNAESVEAQEALVLQALDRWNDKTFVRENTTIFIVLNGQDADSNIKQKIKSYSSNHNALRRMSKLPPIQLLVSDNHDIQETLHRTIINVPSLPSRGELINYLFKLKIDGKVDFNAIEAEPLADILFYYSRPHSYFNQDERSMIEYSQSHSLYAINQRIRFELKHSPKPLVLTQKLLKDEIFKVTLPKSGIDQLNGLIGLESIKARIALEKAILEKKEKKSQTYHYISRLIEDTKNPIGKNTKGSLSFLFLGNPGTGKSTVGNILGQIYKELGVITSGHLVKENAAKLKGRYVGDAAVNLNNLVKRAAGGVLFIDEIAGISSSDENDSTISEINSGILAATDETDNLVTVIAGYPKETEAYLESDPGLRSRFNSDNTFVFNDYSGPELAKIFEKLILKSRKDLGERKFSLDPTVESLLPFMMTHWYRTHQERGLKGWGNGRTVRDFVESIVKRKIQKDDGLNITLDDMKFTFKEIDFKDIIKHCQNNQSEPIDQLKALVGIESVKEDLLKIEKKANLNLPVNRFYVFYGDPGTGKKSTAKILAKLFTEWHLTKDSGLEVIDYYELIKEHNPSALYKGKSKQTVITTGIDALYDNDQNISRFGANLPALFSDLDELKGYYIFIISEKNRIQFATQFPRLWKSSVQIAFPNLKTEDILKLIYKFIERDGYSIEESAKSTLKEVVNHSMQNDPTLNNTDLAQHIYNLLTEIYSQRIEDAVFPIDLDSATIKVFLKIDVSLVLKNLNKGDE